jgi:hypothetical protein
MEFQSNSNRLNNETNFGGTEMSDTMKQVPLDQIDRRNSSKLLQKETMTSQLHNSEDEQAIFDDLFMGLSGQIKQNQNFTRKSDPIYISQLDRKQSIKFSSEDSGSSDSVSLEDFKVLRFINKGTFGSVFLAFLPSQD